MQHIYVLSSNCHCPRRRVLHPAGLQESCRITASAPILANRHKHENTPKFAELALNAALGKKCLWINSVVLFQCGVAIFHLQNLDLHCYLRIGEGKWVFTDGTFSLKISIFLFQFLDTFHFWVRSEMFGLGLFHFGLFQWHNHSALQPLLYDCKRYLDVSCISPHQRKPSCNRRLHSSLHWTI